MMMDFAKRGVYIGLGLAAMTKEKVEEFATEFSRRAQFSEEEGRKFAEFLQDESEKARETLQENMQGMINEALDKFPNRKRIRELEARIAALETVVGDMIDARQKAQQDAEAANGPGQASETE